MTETTLISDCIDLQGDELELQSMCAGIALQVPLNSK
jgi:hypothetical protein